MEQPQTGKKVKKIRAYEQRLARRMMQAIGYTPYVCVCGVSASSEADLDKHMRAKQHGKFAPGEQQRRANAVSKDGEEGVAG